MMLLLACQQHSQPAQRTVDVKILSRSRRFQQLVQEIRGRGKVRHIPQPSSNAASTRAFLRDLWTLTA